ncbi:MAG: M23 family metallopeptidase [Thermoleophilia bacterium]
MRNHRTTARGVFFLSLLLALSLAAASASLALNQPDQPPATGSKPMIFPLVGAATYFDDWGDPRGQGRHAGNDILTTWRSPAVAAEDGKIKFWTTSARAGCMLYLYGASGTTYRYIHLNNDLTAKHDNRGACIPGVAYAPGLKNGSSVRAGQLIAYNGDSGDAEGAYHLHFEVHPHDGVDVSPFASLNAATRLLFPLPARPAKPVTFGLKGTAVAAGGGSIELSVTAVRLWPGGQWATIPPRSLELAVPEDALLDGSLTSLVFAPTRKKLRPPTAARVLVFTRPAPATLAVLSGEPGALSIDRIRPL